jgi:hypothetical protein
MSQVRASTAIAPVLNALPEPARRTLTWDQGSEMARHDRIAPFFSEGTLAAALQHAAPELLIERHRGGHVLDVLHRRAVLEAFQALEASDW